MRKQKGQLVRLGGRQAAEHVAKIGERVVPVTQRAFEYVTTAAQQDLDAADDLR